MDGLERFLNAQEAVYTSALRELERGRKETHWMWFVFPQIDGLGSSVTSRFYALASLGEARAYLAHPVLGRRLAECSRAVLAHAGSDVSSIFANPDDLKLRSCMTLFGRAAGKTSGGEVFRRVIDAFYGGVECASTLERIRDEER